MKIFKQSFTLICMVLASGLYGQEILSGLQINEVVRHKSSETTILPEREMNDNEELQLPFFDDFKTLNGYPDANLWKDKAIFVNKDFPYFAPNIGAATFDAIDSTGAVYGHATWIPFQADMLTTNPIRLDSVFDPITKPLSPADSIYLSFYYQPEGYGDEPESWDTLLLEFSYLTGDTVFAHIDSVLISANYYLDNEQDTIKPFDTLYSPPGCDTTIYKIM